MTLKVELDVLLYYQSLIKDKHLASILDMISELYNLRIEIIENSDEERRRGKSLIDWLVNEEEVSVEQYNNYYPEKRIKVYVLKSDTDKEKYSLLIERLYIYCIFSLYKNKGRPYNEAQNTTESIQNGATEPKQMTSIEMKNLPPPSPEDKSMDNDNNMSQDEKDFKSIVEMVRFGIRSEQTQSNGNGQQGHTLMAQELKEVFDPSCYNENEQHAELNARPAYIQSSFLTCYHPNEENHTEECNKNKKSYGQNRKDFLCLFQFFDKCINEIKEKANISKRNNKSRVVFFLFLLLVFGFIIFSVYLYNNRSTAIKMVNFDDLNASEQEKIFYGPLRYPTFKTNVTLNDLMFRNSSCLKKIRTDTEWLETALDSEFDPCINLKYDNMTLSMRKSFEENGLIIFQGRRKKFVLSKISTKEIYQQLSWNQIKDSMNGELKIGKNFTFNLQNYHERTFVNRKNSSQIFTLDNIKKGFDAGHKIFILTDEVGTGKSMTMKKLSMVLREEDRYSAHWVQYIDVSKLKNFTSIESVLDINLTELQVFKHLYTTNRTILAFDFGEFYNKELIDLIKAETQNIYLFAIDYEYSRKIENDLKTTSYKFEAIHFPPIASSTTSPTTEKSVITYSIFSTSSPFLPDDTKYPETFFKLLSSDPREFYENFEKFLLGKLKRLTRRRRRQASVQVETACIEKLQKLALREIFGDGFLKWKSNEPEINISDMTRIDESSEEFFKKLAESSTEIITNVDGESFEFSHQSWRIFFVVQFFKEKLYDINDENEENLEKIVKMLINFNNNFDTKLSRKFVESLPSFEVKNEKVLKVLNEKFKDVLEKFSKTENPTLLTIFFKNSQSILGSHQKWLNDTFNIDMTKENERGKILYQIWKHRDHQSAKAIQSLTQIKVDEDFILDLKEKQTFREFLDLSVKELTSNETENIILTFTVEIFVNLSKKDLDKIWEKVEDLKITEKVANILENDEKFSFLKVENSQQSLTVVEKHLKYLVEKDRKQSMN